MSKIKAVIFDWGGVLGKVTMKFVRKNVARKLGVSEKDVKKEFKKLEPPLQKGAISEKEYWRRFCKALGLKMPRNWHSLLRTPYEENFKLKRGTLAIAKRVKKKGYKTAILTNTIEAHEHPTKSKIYREFEVVLESHVQKMRKPEKRAFLWIVKKLKVKPSEAVHIDDRKDFVKAAEKAGLKAIHFTTPNALEKELKKMKVL